MSLKALYERRSHLTSQVHDLKVSIAEVDAEILAATQAKVKAMFELAGKQFGTVTVAGEDGVVIKGDVSKKVEWDSTALRAVASSMPWDVAQKVFNIDFSVSEKAFKALPDIGLSAEVIGQITAARTTKYGDMKVSLEVKG